MDREQIIELVAEAARRASGPGEDVVAGCVVDELIARDLLVTGPRRLWRVRVDDPSAVQAYTYEAVEAHSAWAACVKAARRAIVDDPRATVQWQGDPPTEAQRRQLADGTELAEAVARWAVAEEVASAGVPV